VCIIYVCVCVRVNPSFARFSVFGVCVFVLVARLSVTLFLSCVCVCV